VIAQGGNVMRVGVIREADDIDLPVGEVGQRRRGIIEGVARVQAESPNGERAIVQCEVDRFRQRADVERHLVVDGSVRTLGLSRTAVRLAQTPINRQCIAGEIDECRGWSRIGLHQEIGNGLSSVVERRAPKSCRTTDGLAHNRKRIQHDRGIGPARLECGTVGTAQLSRRLIHR
jgi:hypothetical protein